jgi:LuxR family transcriptional regulator, maltose regulon positive regulatory protein
MAKDEPDPRRIIERPRLTRLLDETQAKTILLVAPAGYGKTTLAEQWLGDRPATWYRASASASDVASLATALATALAPFFASGRDRVDAWLRATPNPEADPLGAARILAAAFRDWPDGAWLAIDDFHLIEEDSAAQTFFAHFEAETTMNLLVTARRRPAWASARRLLYGEVFEVGASALAMTADEAEAVLRASTNPSPPGLVVLAEGWPAVIGLAALAGQIDAPPDAVVPSALYDFFAEELFQTTAPEVRFDLCLLAPAARIDVPLASHVLGENRGSYLVDEGVRLGFLSASATEGLLLHPLLREFLLAKAADYDRVPRIEAVGSIVDFAIKRGAWDDAFVAIVEGARPELIPCLVEASLDAVVEKGHTASLRRWLGVAAEHGIRAPLLFLAEAEIAYREGLNARAELLALQAAQQLDPSTPFYARAYLRAGKAGHFIDRGEEALANFARAQEASIDSETRREALWGSFVTAVDIEHANIEEFLTAFEGSATDNVDDLVRLETGRLNLIYRFHNVYDAINGARRLVGLVDDVVSPLVRTAFWNVYAWALTQGARYEEAFCPVDALVADADEHFITFANPHAEFVRGHALLGINEVARARRVADDLDRLAEERLDDFLLINVRTLRARIALASGDYANAFDLTVNEGSGRVENQATRAERLAVRALALLAADEAAEAFRVAEHASSISRCGAPRTLARIVMTLAEADRNDESQTMSKVAALVEKTGQVDAFMLTLRTRPELFGGLPVVENDLVPAIRSGDIRRQVKLNLKRGAEVSAVLSRREREVLRLVSEGYTNAEIGNRLFISDVTVKVHVRHILAKLGVRNRAEAAALAVKRLRD